MPETGCDEDCLNRCVYYECSDENCNVGLEHCQNRQFAALKARVAKKTRFAEGVEVMQVSWPMYCFQCGSRDSLSLHDSRPKIEVLVSGQFVPLSLIRLL